jgi:hypothetical protein
MFLFVKVIPVLDETESPVGRLNPISSQVCADMLYVNKIIIIRTSRLSFLIVLIFLPPLFYFRRINFMDLAILQLEI